MKKFTTKGAIVGATIALLLAAAVLSLVGKRSRTPSQSDSERVVKILKTETALPKKVIMITAKAYAWSKAHNPMMNKNTIAVVDFTQPSDQKRLYIVDLKHESIFGRYAVAHGSGSGLRYPTRFSNQEHSHQSSLGAFLVGKKYRGHHGLSRRLTGLEKGVNSHARQRAIVIHQASYVSDAFIRQHHRAGRSWGCFAVAPKAINEVLNKLPKNTLLFAYAKPELNDKHFRT